MKAAITRVGTRIAQIIVGAAIIGTFIDWNPIWRAWP